MESSPASNMRRRNMTKRDPKNKKMQGLIANLFFSPKRGVREPVPCLPVRFRVSGRLLFRPLS